MTHEFGHAINLAHTQTNGFYSSNNPSAWSRYAGGPEQAGPDQCGPAAAGYPAANQIETMYPMIDPYPDSPTYNSPEMAKVQDDADDMAALSAIYPAPGYAATTGTLKGMLVAKDGTSQITGINVIARRVDSPLDGALSRISGDSTQGLLGADGTFTMTGLVPGASYVVYIDELRAGAFSTPRSLLLGPEEYWNSAESGDASKDDACASTPVDARGRRDTPDHDRGERHRARADVHGDSVRHADRRVRQRPAHRGYLRRIQSLPLLGLGQDEFRQGRGCLLPRWIWPVRRDVGQWPRDRRNRRRARTC